MKKKKKMWKDYFSFRIYVNPAELETFAALAAGKDKKSLSRNVFELVRRNMPGLSGAALAPPGQKSGKRGLRRLHLASLPEYADVMRFIRINARFTSFKEALTVLLLYGIVPEGHSGGQTKPAAPPAPAAVHPAQPAVSPARQPAGPESRPSPRVLFGGSLEKLAKAIVLDLAHWQDEPGLDRARYDWLAMPPSEYPEEIREYPAFTTLRSFWEHHHNSAKG